MFATQVLAYLVMTINKPGTSKGTWAQKVNLMLVNTSGNWKMTLMIHIVQFSQLSQGIYCWQELGGQLHCLQRPEKWGYHLQKLTAGDYKVRDLDVEKILFFLWLTYLFERERTHKQGEGQERERISSRLRLLAELGSHDPEITTWAEIKSQTLNGLSHRGTPRDFL